jgi:hypothetical protein
MTIAAEGIATRTPMREISDSEESAIIGLPY